MLFPATSGRHGDKPRGGALFDAGRRGNVPGCRGPGLHIQGPRRRSSARRAPAQEPLPAWFFSARLLGQMIGTGRRPG